MSSIIPTPVGNPIRLNLQLDDGEQSLPKKIKAYLRDELGNLLPNSPVQLTHVGGGLFKDYSLIMDDKPEITAQYKVFEDDGITESNYSIEFDTFVKPVTDISHALMALQGADAIDILVEDDPEEIVLYIEDGV